MSWNLRRLCAVRELDMDVGELCNRACVPVEPRPCKVAAIVVHGIAMLDPGPDSALCPRDTVSCVQQLSRRCWLLAMRSQVSLHTAKLSHDNK